MKLLPMFPGRPVMHQSNWDELLLMFGAPVFAFAVLRWFGVRRRRREARGSEGKSE